MSLILVPFKNSDSLKLNLLWGRVVLLKWIAFSTPKKKKKKKKNKKKKIIFINKQKNNKKSYFFVTLKNTTFQYFIRFHSPTRFI